MIIVLKPALQSTVQDLGRTGFRHLGVGRAGAMDALSMRIGNRLVGNLDSAAGLELTLPPARLRFDCACTIALTGADCEAWLDDVSVHPGRAVAVEAGQVLSVAAPRSGVHAYLCVSGGIDVPPVMGSRSTDLQAGIGGLQGRMLQAGDSLPSPQPDPAAQAASAAPIGVLLPQMGNPIRAVPGPASDGFDPAALGTLWSNTWTVTALSNRMGYRLEGPPIARRDSEELKSHAVFPGTIQVPQGGAPIVLMADAPATGGYPKIAAVIAADLWRLAQACPGRPVRFAEATRAQAHAAWQKQQDYLQRLQRSLDVHRSERRRR